MSTQGGGVPMNPAQVHDGLNEYYARWWSQYGGMVAKNEAGEAVVQEAPAPAEVQTGPQAFDKGALARLAEMAAQNEELEAQREAVQAAMAAQAALAPPPAPMPPQMPVMQHQEAPPPTTSIFATSQAMPQNANMSAGQQQQQQHQSMLGLVQPREGDLVERASCEVRQLLGDLPPLLPTPSASAGPAPGAQAVPTLSSMVQPPPGPGAPQQMSLPPQVRPPMPSPGMPTPRQPFGGFSLFPSSVGQKPQKDNDSVQNMLQRLQSNVQQTKNTMSVHQAVPHPGPNQQPMSQPMQQVLLPQPATDVKILQTPEWDSGLEHRVSVASAPAEIEEVGKTLLMKFPRLPVEQIAELLHKMERMIGMYHGEFLSELSRLLAGRLRETTSTQFATLMSSFLLWKEETRERFSEFAKEFAMTASSELPSRLMEMAPHELNCCLAGFMALGFADQRFFTAVGRSMLARHKTFAPAQLCALLTILAEMRLVHVDLFTSAAQVICSRVRELRPVDLIRVLRAFTKCNVQHETLCHAISNDICNRFKDKGAQGAAFKCEDLCEVAWMFCVLQSYHEEFFRLLLKQLEETPKVSTDALCMLYEVHLVLDSEYKDAYAKYRIPADKVPALLEIYKNSRKDARRCSERLRADVSSVLKSLVEGTVHANHRTSIGLLADVAALRKRTSADGYIHIDIDTPLTVVRPLDHDDPATAPLMPDGSVALKRRLLQKYGLRLITVKEQEWRRLEDSKEKRRHLRTLLASLGEVLE